MEKTAEALEVLRLLLSVGMGQQVEWGRQSSSCPAPVRGVVRAGFQQMLSRKGSMKEGESQPVKQAGVGRDGGRLNVRQNWKG